MTECPHRYVKATITEFHVEEMVLRLILLDPEHQTRSKVGLIDT